MPYGDSGNGGIQMEMKAPQRCVGRIIGRGGSRIKQLQEESGARINIKKDQYGDMGDEATVELSGGSEESCLCAKQLIEDICKEQSGGGGYGGGYEGRRDQGGHHGGHHGGHQGGHHGGYQHHGGDRGYQQHGGDRGYQQHGGDRGYGGSGDGGYKGSGDGGYKGSGDGGYKGSGDGGYKGGYN